MQGRRSAPSLTSTFATALAWDELLGSAMAALFVRGVLHDLALGMAGGGGRCVTLVVEGRRGAAAARDIGDASASCGTAFTRQGGVAEQQLGVGDVLGVGVSSCALICARRSLMRLFRLLLLVLLSVGDPGTER